MSSTEAARAAALGLTVTVATPATWDAMTAANFASYSAVIIGDPSASACSSSVPADALSTAGTWGPAVTGNVAVLGTAPALGGAGTLISDAIAYAASGSATGLYVSLNCEYSTASAGTAVPLLASVEGGGFTVTGQGSSCPGNAGTVNAFQALALSPFNGLGSGNLGPWSSPACSVQETFGSWPAGLGGLGFLGGASPALFTASDGSTGQAYILAGSSASAATSGLSPSTGGQVPALAAVGGSNPAAPGVSADTAGDPVDTENGDFTQSNTDVSIPTFGPSLDFSRTYDAALAQQQSEAATPVPPGAPGSLGYGWTDDWDTWLSASRIVSGDIYTIDGLETSTGRGGAATSAAMNSPGGVATHGSDVYIADSSGNRVEEIPGSSGTQWGIAMTAGDVYTVVGSDTGAGGVSCSNGTAMASCLLNDPEGVNVDSAGDLFVADTGNNRVLEIPAASGTNYGLSMTADDAYTVAGHGTGASGHGGDGGAANVAFLDSPTQVILGVGGDTSLFIADELNNRVQEVFETGGEQWGQSMTANDIYTVAGSSAGTAGNSGDGGAATSARLSDPLSVTLSSGGDLYVADTGNNQVREMPKTSGTQWGQSVTANDIYTVAGQTSGTSGISSNGTAGGSSSLFSPAGVVANNGTQLYITELGNNRVSELARTGHSEWGITMTADEIYDIAGSATGAGGYSGNGGLATSAVLAAPGGQVAFSSAGMYVPDTGNNEIRLVSASTFDISDLAGGAGTFAQDGDGGPAVGAGLETPVGVASDSHGDIFVADSGGNRVQELAAYSHTQFGIAMTAGDVYTVAGSAAGFRGLSGNGGPAASALLSGPVGVAVDPAGNLDIADTNNARVQQVSAATGHISTIAGSATGNAGSSGLGGPATSALLASPQAVAVDAAGDVFIADTNNEVVDEVPAASGTSFGIAMTAGHLYAIAGSVLSPGTSGDGGPSTSALVDQPEGVAADAAGNVYISDSGNNRIQEIAASTHVQWGMSMTGNDIYTVAGSATGGRGFSGDGGAATAATMNVPGQISVDSSGNLYIPDEGNHRIREVAAGSGTQWGQQMAAGAIYTVAGTGTAASTGDGGAAAAAGLVSPAGVTADPFGDVYLTDATVLGTPSDLREVTAGGQPFFPTSPAAGSTWAASGITITQPGGSQITFYPKSGGSCVSPYVAAGSGGFCALPLYAGVNLTFSSGGGGTYTFTPSPGESYTYGSGGALQSETDAAGNTLTITYGTPAPGTGNCPATASACDTITSASGRALVIGYNSASLVTSVTDPLARRWTYTYTGSDLTKATDPLGNATTYTYDTSNTDATLANDMLTITGPNAQPGGPDAGDDTVNVYDSDGRVTKQTDPMGFVTKFNYCVNAAAGDCMNASTGTGFTTITDPDGNTTVDSYLSGSLTGTANYTGGTTEVAQQAYAPDQSSAGTDAGTQLNVAAADGDNNITTLSHNAGGQTTAITQPGDNGVAGTTTWAYTSLQQASCEGTARASTTANCSGSSAPTPVSPGGVITPPSTAPPLGLTYTLYDTDGNELYSTVGVYEPGTTTAAYAETTYQLFAGNSVTLGGTTVNCAATPPSASLPCATIDANGVVTQLAYNSAGDLTSSSTPDGNGTQVSDTTYTYDADGEQLTEVAPDGNVTGGNAGNYTTATAYDADGEATSVTAGGGTGHTVTARTTNYGFDANGDPTTVEDARGFTTTTTYDADSRPTLVTDPDGNATLKCYDGNGQPAQVVPPVGVAANSLTPASCPTAYPAGYTNRLASDATTNTYSASGQLTATTTPAPAGQTGSETTTYTYDPAGNQTQITSPPVSSGGSPVVTADTYNAAGDLATQTSASGTAAASTVSYCYDPDGNVTSVVMPDGNTSGVAACETSSPYVVNSTSHPTQAAYQTTSSYDSAGNLVSTTSPATTAAPSGATTSYTYDAEGNQLTSADPNGVTATMTYTPQDQPSSVSYSGSSAHSVSYGYDADGNRTSMSDASGSSSYVWDSFGELTSATNGAANTVGYSYDADGEPTGITYPLPSGATWATSNAVSYGYDHADRLNSVTDFNGHQITIGDTADGLPNSMALGSTGDTIATTYSPTDSPSLISLKNSTSTLQSFSYSNAPAGNISSETDTPTSTRSPAVYTYDARGRVTSMTPGSLTANNYGFDASGNLTTLPAGATGTYNDGSELTSSSLSGTSTSYTYNADGQRLTAVQGSATVASGTWNGASELTAYSDSSAAMSSTTYDGDGLRAAATFTPTGGSAASQAFVWGRNSRLLMDSGNAYIYAGGVTPVEQVNLSSGALTYLSADSLGSVRGTVSSSGSLSASTSYDAWGNPSTSGGLTATTPFGYAGGYTDPDGLIYLINRYYDPATGQFTSVDPDVTDTLEPYAYADDDPVALSDPTGLYWWDYGTDVGGCLGYCDTQYVDYSAHMALKMDAEDKIIEKAGHAGESISAMLSSTIAYIAGAVGTHKAALIVGGIALVVLAVGLTTRFWIAVVFRMFRKNLGKRVKKRGFWVSDHWHLGSHRKFTGAGPRKCPSEKPSCGTPGNVNWAPRD